MILKAKTDPPSCTTSIMAMQDSLDVLGGKWKLLILHYLIYRENETNTFKKIEKDLDKISAKILSQELKTLELNLLIEREVKQTKPITVEYRITDYGKSIKPIIQDLVKWGTNHRLVLIADNK